MASMTALFRQSFDRGERSRLAAFFGGVGALHVAGWGLLLFYGLGHPTILALGGLAYTFGLRHAFDADHIAAIDNTTRKLLRDGHKPVGVGFFFSLGHSTVVFLIAAALGLTVKWIVDGVITDGGQLRSIGGIVGTTVSGSFLVLIGIMNLVILLDIFRVYRRMRAGDYDRESLEHELTAGGFMTRIFGRLFRVINHSWQMYPIGFLFGLGFDTASEVAFMAKAYSWAFASPIRKVFYNLTMTSLSVFVALFIGLAELLQLLVRMLHLKGGLYDTIGAFDLGRAGFFIVGAFVLAWAAALMIYKARRIDERWAELVDEVA